MEAAVLTLIENGEENAAEVKSGGVTCTLLRSRCNGDLILHGTTSITQQQCTSWCEDQGSGCCEYRYLYTGIHECYHSTSTSYSYASGCNGRGCPWIYAGQCRPTVCGDFGAAEFQHVCSGGCGGSNMCPSPNTQHKCSGTCGVHEWKGGGNSASVCKDWCMQQGPGCCESRSNGACSWKSDPSITFSSAYTDARAVECIRSVPDVSPSDSTVSVQNGSIE